MSPATGAVEEGPYIGLDAIKSWGDHINPANSEKDGNSLGNRFKVGDVLFGKLRPYLAKVASPQFDGHCSGEALVLRPTPDVDTSFLRYRLVEAGTIDAIDASTYGAKMPRASWDFIGNLQIALPDLDTQKAIAAFLDRETARIDQLIEKKECLIELDNSRLRSLLQELVLGGASVRRGLGGDWLHQLPNGWRLMPLKHLIQIRGGATPSKEREEFWIGDIPWVSPKAMKSDLITDVPDQVSEIALESSAIQLIPADAVLIVVRGMILARTIPVCRLGIAATINQDMKALLPRKKVISSIYLQRLLQGFEGVLMSFIEEAAHGTKKLRSEALFGLKFPVPPLVDQREICLRYEQERLRSDTLSVAILTSIDRLREKRTALITAAVTGQIDVREKLLAVTTKSDRRQVRCLVGAEIVSAHRNSLRFGRVKQQKELYLAEAHLGISELEGNYLREAAGPYDLALIEDTEQAMAAAGFYRADQPDGRGTAVTYTALAKAGQHKAELDAILGERADTLRNMINMLRDLDRKAIEAVATLYAVWNDALMDGDTPSDDAIINGALTDWHPEKPTKFNRDDLARWLGWMRRHDLVPKGEGPRTSPTMTPDMFS